ncbi:F420-dependent oxidoreductase [Paenibacillus sambharensis]|uniref:F420-dependent oxidoreductase n=1 Tax=Paenibacillus sambharensis TaxID=1803190 RepID=A0A2W1LW54_9BACL|nr:F420-dependent oxidoreductase [Paenibacillus sambharensis]
MRSSEVEFGWFIPTTGDGRYLGVEPERPATQAYMTEVAVAAEEAGFEFALIPAGGDCLDAWVVGSWIGAQTTRLKPLVALRPGLISPVLAARMAATLDQVSGGRALINVVTGHYAEDLKASGDPLYANHDERYNRTREFMEIVRGVWQAGAGAFDYKGRHYEVEGGRCLPAPFRKPHPPVYFGGSSPAGKRAAAAIADVYLMWTEPLEWIKEQITEMQQFVLEHEKETGIRRQLQFGIRAQLVVRETEEEAWAAARSIISKVDPSLLNERAKRHAQTDATNQKRQMELWQQSQEDDYVIGPNLWSGLSAVRGGGAVAFVGTPEQVSDRLVEFADAGISSFILSGYPHLEEARIAGKLLLPLVRKKLAGRIAVQL